MKIFSVRDVKRYNLIVLYLQASCQGGKVCVKNAQRYVLYMYISI